MHSRFRCARSIALLFLVAMMSSCGPRDGAEMEPSPGIYKSPGGIKFSVKITPERFSLGEPVTLEASMFNDGDDTYEKEFASGCQWDYEVATENGRVVAPSRMCAMALSELRLEPGELRVILREWKGNDDYFGAGGPLAPGRYSVTAGFVDEHTRVVAMSEPVWIEIVAPKSRR